MLYEDDIHKQSGWDWLLAQKKLIIPSTGITVLYTRIACLNLALSLLIALAAFLLEGIAGSMNAGLMEQIEVAVMSFVLMEFFLLPLFWLALKHRADNPPPDPTEW